MTNPKSCEKSLREFDEATSQRENMETDLVEDRILLLTSKSVLLGIFSVITSWMTRSLGTIRR